ncbi:hypothetical protein [Scytonema sp. HK-05]|uniref:hypothetical protein n=1 Tax=Scytonema sp. HK-05 TaxID=1137095 RepID=UPI0009364082|nr:hypothetical protein [Scytonema sp. HK-05]OKH56526.1 hypothetical protein NIES2130_25065 [Scytonema sp. HK-05]
MTFLTSQTSSYTPDGSKLEKIHFQAALGNEKNVATFTDKLNIKLIPKIDILVGKTSYASFARLQRN